MELEREMFLYELTVYEHDSYSYLGVTERDSYLFRTEERAKEYAAQIGLEVVCTCEHPEKQCTIEPTFLYT